MRNLLVLALLVELLAGALIAGESGDRLRTSFPPAPDRPLGETLSDTVSPPGDELD